MSDKLPVKMTVILMRKSYIITIKTIIHDKILFFYSSFINPEYYFHPIRTFHTGFNG